MSKVDRSFIPTSNDELLKALGSWEWRMFSGQLYKITTKGDEADDDEPEISVPFSPTYAQEELLKNLHYRNVVLKARQLGFCLDPETRVLTASLEWKRIADIRPGDELVATDEDVPGGKGPSRKMRTATVQATAVTHQDAYRITFDDGRSVVCTGGHRWLSRKAGVQTKWRKIDEPSKGRLTVGSYVRWVASPWGDAGFEDGWMGGMIDGEGSMAAKHTSGAEINVSQREGAVWDRLVSYASSRGYNARIEADNNPQRESKHGKTAVPKLCFSRLDELFRLVGQTRPSRFIGRRFWEGKNLPGKKTGAGWAKIVSIEPVGKRDMIDLQTSTKTFIAEGFVSHNSTLIEIMALDHALFNRDQEVVVIAHTKDAATKLYRKKVCFAYDQLPPFVRELVPTTERSQTQMVFANGSSIEVTSSARGGTPHFLHISEMGKIAAKYPDRAVEITTGSLQGVPKTGLVFIESTAEGQGGAFHAISDRAEKRSKSEASDPLTPIDYRFHFFPWHIQQEYCLPPDEAKRVKISVKEHAYFDRIEGEMDVEISLGQRAWYVNKRDTDFADTPDLMWREYPSTPAECWAASTDGKYYASAMARARKEGRITDLPIQRHVPVNTFWDLGASDDTAIWLHQEVDGWDHWIGFYEQAGAGYLHFLQWLDSHDYIWGEHFLPHDAEQKRQQRQDLPSDWALASPVMILREMKPSWTWRIVPRVQNIQHGIDLTRAAFDTAKWDAKRCKEGIEHLESYSREWNTRLQIWHDHPRHDQHSHCADAIRQHAQGYTKHGQLSHLRTPGGGEHAPKRRRATGLTA